MYENEHIEQDLDSDHFEEMVQNVGASGMFEEYVNTKPYFLLSLI